HGKRRVPNEKSPTALETDVSRRWESNHTSTLDVRAHVKRPSGVTTEEDRVRNQAHGGAHRG
ncbi:MAG: hypothetical protein ACPIOQ_59470, partial [Promethearchaeia archaeon]